MPLDARHDLAEAISALTPAEVEGLAQAYLFCWNPHVDALCCSRATAALLGYDLEGPVWTLAQAATLVADETLQTAVEFFRSMRALRSHGPVHLELHASRGLRSFAARCLPVQRDGVTLMLGALVDETEALRLRHDLETTARVMTYLANVAQIGAWELDLLSGAVRLSPEAQALASLEDGIPLAELAREAAIAGTDLPALERFIAAVRGGSPAEVVLGSEREGLGGRRFRLTARPAIEGSGDVGRIDGTITDVTAVIDAAMDRARLAAAFDATNQGVCVTDADQRIVLINPAFTAITGYNASEVLGQRPSILASGKQDAAFYAEMWRTIARVGRWSGELWNRRKDGSLYPESLTIAELRDGRKVTGYVGLFADQSAREADRVRQVWADDHDALTGLLNRQGLEHGARALAGEVGGGPALLMLDLDGFGAVNARLGTNAGDKLLRLVAARLRETVRAGDLVARIGSDDFAVLVAQPQSPLRLAERIRSRLRGVFEVEGTRLHLDAVFGYAGSEDREVGLPTLLSRAASALDVARERGRGSVVAYEEAMGQRVAHDFDIAHALADALMAGQLFTVFQPQFSLKTGAVVGAETLMRWQHPTEGFVRPDRFIDAAERTGDIIALGALALRSGLELLARADAAGLWLGRIAVNVSGAEIRAGGLEAGVRMALAATGVAADRLELEVTEGVFVREAGAATQLEALRRLGVQTAIDDFGVGFSSLSRLKRLPVDRLKIDRSFVIGLPEDAADGAVCRSILDLARNMGLAAIAEGVETEAQEQWLREAGCEESQGYLRGRPISGDELLALLAAQAS